MSGKYKVTPIRLEASTIAKVTSLAARLHLRPTVLMRQMIEREVAVADELLGGDLEGE